MRLIKKLLFALLIISLSLGVLGCSSNYVANVSMIEPEPSEDSSLKYVEDDFEIEFTPLFLESMRLKLNQIEVSLKNKSDSTMRIIWEESAFINTEGESSSLVRGDMNYKDINIDPTDSIVPAGTINNTVVIPRNTIYWDDGVKRRPIISVSSSSEAKKYNGETLSFLILIEKDEEVREYRFQFEILLEEVESKKTRVDY